VALITQQGICSAKTVGRNYINTNQVLQLNLLNQNIKLKQELLGLLGGGVVIISLMVLIVSIICIEDIENRMEELTEGMEGASLEELQNIAEETQDLAEQAKEANRMFRWSIVGCIVGILIIIKQIHVKNVE